MGEKEAEGIEKQPQTCEERTERGYTKWAEGE